MRGVQEKSKGNYPGAGGINLDPDQAAISQHSNMNNAAEAPGAATYEPSDDWAYVTTEEAAGKAHKELQGCRADRTASTGLEAAAAQESKSSTEDTQKYTPQQHVWRKGKIPPHTVEIALPVTDGELLAKRVEDEDAETIAILSELAGCRAEVAADGNAPFPDMLSRSSVLWALRDLLLLLPADSHYR